MSYVLCVNNTYRHTIYHVQYPVRNFIPASLLPVRHIVWHSKSLQPIWPFGPRSAKKKYIGKKWMFIQLYCITCPSKAHFMSVKSSLEIVLYLLFWHVDFKYHWSYLSYLIIIIMCVGPMRGDSVDTLGRITESQKGACENLKAQYP